MEAGEPGLLWLFVPACLACIAPCEDMKLLQNTSKWRACTLQWQPSREGYLRFLTESKEVYETLEGIVAEAHHPDCEHLRSCHNSDLTRAAACSRRVRLYHIDTLLQSCIGDQTDLEGRG